MRRIFDRAFLVAGFLVLVFVVFVLGAESVRLITGETPPKLGRCLCP